VGVGVVVAVGVAVLVAVDVVVSVRVDVVVDVGVAVGVCVGVGVAVGDVSWLMWRLYPPLAAPNPSTTMMTTWPAVNATLSCDVWLPPESSSQPSWLPLHAPLRTYSTVSYAELTVSIVYEPVVGAVHW
jgi:hypothetical protein